MCGGSWGKRSGSSRPTWAASAPCSSVRWRSSGRWTVRARNDCRGGPRRAGADDAGSRCGDHSRHWIGRPGRGDARRDASPLPGDPRVSALDRREPRGTVAARDAGGPPRRGHAGTVPPLRRLHAPADRLPRARAARARRAAPGPNLETRAEYRMLRTLGADVVGMSTVPEVITAVHLGMRVLGVSIITDQCLPDALEPATVERIIAVARAAEPKLTALIRGVLERHD